MTASHKKRKTNKIINQWNEKNGDLWGFLECEGVF